MDRLTLIPSLAASCSALPGRVPESDPKEQCLRAASSARAPGSRRSFHVRRFRDDTATQTAEASQVMDANLLLFKRLGAKRQLLDSTRLTCFDLFLVGGRLGPVCRFLFVLKGAMG